MPHRALHVVTASAHTPKDTQNAALNSFFYSSFYIFRTKPRFFARSFATYRHADQEEEGKPGRGEAETDLGCGRQQCHRWVPLILTSSSSSLLRKTLP